MRVLPLLLLTLLAGPAVAQESEAPAGCQEDNSDCREDCTVEYGGSTRTYSKLGTCLQRCKQKYDKCRERHYSLQERDKLGIEPSPGPKSPPPGEPSRHSPTDEGSSDDLESASESSGHSANSSSGARSGVYHASDDEAGSPAAQSTAGREGTEKKPAPKPSPAPKTETVDPVVRSGVYRASAPEPEPDKTPEPKASAKSEPTAKSESTKPSEPAKPTAKSEPAATSKAAQPDPLADEEPPPPPRLKPQPKTEPPRSKPPPDPKKDISDWDPDAK